MRSPVHKKGVLVALAEPIRDLFLEGQAKLKRKSVSKITYSVSLGQKGRPLLEIPPIPAFIAETPPILSEQNELITSETLRPPPK